MTLDFWTLGFQTVNVVILVWLLQHFFWRPVSAMIEERRSTTETALAEAKAAQDKAAAALDEVARTRAGFGTERAAILATAQAEAEQVRTATLDDATRKAADVAAMAKMSIDRDRAKAESAWSDGASKLAVDIAGRLAGRLVGGPVGTAFLEWLLTSIRALPDEVRRAAAADGATLEAVSAVPLDPAEQDHCRSLIGEAFGARPRITFRSDQALIAGFELHGPHFVVENSWRADLGKISQDIDHVSQR